MIQRLVPNARVGWSRTNGRKKTRGIDVGFHERRI
jgi:hypothetical protein